MAVIGSYLDVVFEVSNNRLNTFENFSRTTDGRFEKHAIKNKKPLLEFEGPNEDTASFDVKLRAAYGINPLVELEKWKKSYRRGKRGIFLIGNKPLSVNTYIISKITEHHTTYDGKGNVLTIELSIEILEYPEPSTSNNSKAKPKTSSTAAPASKKQLGIMTIKVKSVHIRSGPGTKYKVLGYTYKRKQLKVYGKKNGWYDLGGGKYITASNAYSNFKAVS